ncbi:hypothetical protein [Novipirellula caenicola]|uniref:Uncharacterized protein n=1 Tax=Novipirellula caenicola TaxID=1536901 RepID=A0ABP9VLW1_9BACT
MNSFDQDPFSPVPHGHEMQEAVSQRPATSLRDPASSRRRIFLATAAILIAVWFVTNIAASLLNSQFVYGGPLGETTIVSVISSGLMGITQGILVAAALQIAVWWQWPAPRRPSWKILGLLIASYSALNLYPYLDFQMWQMFGERWYGMLGLMLVFHLIVVPLYLLGMSVPGRLWQFRLMDTRDDKVSAPLSSPSPQRWSIAGIFLMTLLIAVLMAVYQGMRRLFEPELSSSVVVSYPPNDLVMMLYHAADIIADLIVLWAASLSYLRRHRVAVVLLLFSISLSTLAEYAYMSIVNAGQPFVQIGWFSIFVRHGVSVAAVYLVSRWCFRRWRTAGFQMRGWVQGREMATR